MSDPVRIALVGASGLIGRAVMELAAHRADVRLVAVARREVALPRGARMELFVAEPERWGEVFEAARPDVLVSALGTTWRKSGRDEEAFRAVDYELVLATARAAYQHGVERMIAVSSVGADTKSRNFYLKTKGEAERDLARVGFKRLDLFQPGLLRGSRSGDRRLLERIGIMASPLTDLFMQGNARRYRSISARTVAEAALALALRKAAGRFKHDNDAIHRAARTLAVPVGQQG
jgi:uncharacterized protein YbjT (DUF2867 family)